MKMPIPKKYVDYAKEKGWIKEEKGRVYLMCGIGAPYEIEIINHKNNEKQSAK